MNFIVAFIYLGSCSPGAILLASGARFYFSFPLQLTAIAICSFALIAIGMFVACAIHSVVVASPETRPVLICEYVKQFNIAQIFENLVSRGRPRDD